jgi:hypothetical protein
MKITDEQLNGLRDDSGLKDAVIDWLLNEDSEYRDGMLEDLLQYGCQSGMVSGLIYYSDTVDFYNEHKEDIFDIAIEDYDNMGYKNIFELFANLNGANDIGCIDQMENLLAWYGFEQAAYRISGSLGI